MTSPHRWSDSLDKLLQLGTITGYVHITAHGPSELATGLFKEEGSQATTSPALQQLIKTFYEAAEPPKAYTLWGTKLIVLHQTDSWYIAVSKHRRVGVVALNLPGGVLLASFDRSVLPTVALSAVQSSCSSQGGQRSNVQHQHQQAVPVVAAT